MPKQSQAQDLPRSAIDVPDLETDPCSGTTPPKVSAMRPRSSGEETWPSSADHTTPNGAKTSLGPQAIAASLAECAGIETCEAAGGLGAIARPDVELVIWRRSLPLCLQTWLEQLDATLLPDLRVLVQPKDLVRAMEPFLNECGLPEGEMRALLVCDVGNLVSAFARIARTDLVDVRLERVSGDACRKFHRDFVAARLLTTYRGPATEWVQPRHAETALRAQKSFKGPIEHLGAQDVAIFKGSCAGPGSGIVHRSPPIAGTGRTRLLLCLNTPSAASPEPWPNSYGNDVRYNEH